MNLNKKSQGYYDAGGEKHCWKFFRKIHEEFIQFIIDWPIEEVASSPPRFKT